MRRSSSIALIVSLFVAFGAAPASASVTLGQLPPGDTIGPPGNTDWAQPTVTSGNSYVVPGNGTITSWSHLSWGVIDNEPLTMKIWRPVAGQYYQVVGHDGPHPLPTFKLNTFPTNIPVQTGDILGAHLPQSSLVGLLFDAPGGGVVTVVGDAPDGGLAPFSPYPGSVRLNLTAVFVPYNTFGFGGIARNTKKGTGTLTINDLPSPGELSGSGKGAKVSSSGAMTSKTVSARTATLTIKAKGDKKRTLNDIGKVKLKISVTYTPTGGDPNTQKIKVKLLKR